ncbi:thioredoxin family protein [Diaminobutyricibacter tongyongensis]|uniref:thioredoxin family protein n=1 Tax=Leifsonia tongyongensis TaxID=1268043 RepID=UPI0030843FC4
MVPFLSSALIAAHHAGNIHASEKGSIMGTIELTDDNFQSTIKENDIVLVDFWATWCRPSVRANLRAVRL